MVNAHLAAPTVVIERVLTCPLLVPVLVPSGAKRRKTACYRKWKMRCEIKRNSVMRNSVKPSLLNYESKGRRFESCRARHQRTPHSQGMRGFCVWHDISGFQYLSTVWAQGCQFAAFREDRAQLIYLFCCFLPSGRCKKPQCRMTVPGLPGIVVIATYMPFRTMGCVCCGSFNINPKWMAIARICLIVYAFSGIRAATPSRGTGKTW